MVALMTAEAKAETAIIGELVAGFQDSTRGIERMVRAYAEGVARKMDMSPEVLAKNGIPVAVTQRLALVVQAKLVPEFYPKIAHLSQAVIRSIGRLPATEQTRLASGGGQLHLGRRVGGEVVVDIVPLERVPTEYANVIVDDAGGEAPGRLLTPEEQLERIEARDRQRQKAEDEILWVPLRLEAWQRRKLQEEAKRAGKKLLSHLTEKIILADVVPMEPERHTRA